MNRKKITISKKNKAWFKSARAGDSDTNVPRSHLFLGEVNLLYQKHRTPH